MRVHSFSSHISLLLCAVGTFSTKVYANEHVYLHHRSVRPQNPTSTSSSTSSISSSYTSTTTITTSTTSSSSTITPISNAYFNTSSTSTSLSSSATSTTYTLPCASATPTRAVFAHYLVGTITSYHALRDVEQAAAMGIDAFALNVGDPSQDYVREAIDYLFQASYGVGFKLFLSMDTSALGTACYYYCGAACNGLVEYNWILEKYGNSTYYYHVDDYPLVTTFTSGGLEFKDWHGWQQNVSEALGLDIYMVPDFDDTQGYYQAADGWWNYWGDAVCGTSSWEASWPAFGIKTNGDVVLDETVIEGTSIRNKTYMIGMSSIHYKDAYNTNYYRRGGLVLPQRMHDILQMSPAPNFVQQITWNDGPESHNIGELWPETNTDFFPNLYMNQTRFSHTGFQSLVASFTSAFKSQKQVMEPVWGQRASGALWYVTTTASTNCTLQDEVMSFPPTPVDNYCHQTTGYPNSYYLTPAQGANTSDFYLNWAVVTPGDALNQNWQAIIISNDTVVAVETLAVGLNYGIAPAKPGKQYMVIRDGMKTTVMKAVGNTEISDDCVDGIYNLNFAVAGLEAVFVDPFTWLIKAVEYMVGDVVQGIEDLL